MSVYLEIVNNDNMFNCLREVPIIVNDLQVNSEEDKEAIRKLVYTKYSSDMLSILPSCDCGKTQGEYALGMNCVHCETPVKSQVDEIIEPLLWFRKPEGVNKLINPMILTMLNNRFKKSGFEIIQWICDTTYRTTVKQPKLLNDIADAGIQRGYNNFVDNFDSIMNFLFNIKDFKLKKGNIDYLQELIVKNRDIIFSNYLPLPNKSLLIIEKTNLGIYLDTTISGAIDAISMITSIDSPLSEHSPRVKENRTIKSIVKVSEYYEKFYKNNLAGKPGIIRKHIVGSRSHYSFRAVISSLTGVHKYDEIEVPWGIGVTAFRQHLINKLLKLGYDYNGAVGFLLGHVEKYNALIDKMLQELITESKHGRIPVLLNRNYFNGSFH